MFHDSTAVLALSREENPTAYQKTLGLNDFYFGDGRLRVPARQRPDGRQVDGADVPRRATAGHEARARVDARADGAPCDRLLALDRGPPAAGQPRHRRPRRQHHAHLHGDEPRGQEAAVREGQVDARGARHEPGPPHPPLRVHEERHPDRRLRAPGGHLPVRHRPGDVGARRELQGARARQPVRRRHERLPEHRRGEPGAHGDGELAPRRRPPARARCGSPLRPERALGLRGGRGGRRDRLLPARVRHRRLRRGAAPRRRRRAVDRLRAGRDRRRARCAPGRSSSPAAGRARRPWRSPGRERDDRAVRRAGRDRATATSARSSSRWEAGCGRTRSPAARSSTATAPTRSAGRVAGRC